MTIKVIVTHLKAPWPKGTKVDSVVSLDGEEVPAWAAGKCRLIGKSEGDADSKSKGKSEGGAK